ncbi:MAG: ABC transporter ATP-binding protein [Deltaproteobacteria bacterium]|nr:ABC transporter ATP-binding protein [Deltaproteobacteria bacterium]
MGMMGPPQKAKQFGASARRLVGLLAPQRRLIYVVVALALASVSLSVAGPKILGRATDLIFEGFFGARLPAGLSKAEAVAQIRASGNERTADLLDGMNVVPGRGIDFSALAQILALAMGLYVAASLLMWLQGHLLNRVVQHTIKRLRADVDAKLMRVPLAYFDRQQHGEVLSRVTNDIDNVAMGLQQTLSQVLIAALTALGILVMLVVISPLLALIVLVTVPLSVVATAKIGKRAQVAFVAQWKHVGQLNGQIEEAFTGHALVKVFGRRAAVEEKFRAKNGELFDAGYRAQFVSSLIMPAINFVGNLTYIAIAVVGGLRVSSGAMTLGGVQAFIQYSRQFSQNLSQLAQVANILQSGVASAERVFELLDEPDQSPEHDGALPRELRGEVRFENVSFRYNQEAPLIEDLSLVASPGQTVAIVGPTGAGKTTLVNLLMRFYDLGGGAIRIDGVDIAGVSRAELRARFGMVLQDTWLFSGTIRDNIKYGRPGATEEEMLAAARATYVDRFVRALPAGYDTVIDEESSNLSTGEKQLITIARAFLADPAILILDEATSSVDTRTEVLVQRAMATLRERRTSFVIAHRLSTIRDADLILVLEKGAIVEQGTHEQLLHAGGAYHALYHAQFAAPAPG